jgi:hypothetical protein
LLPQPFRLLDEPRFLDRRPGRNYTSEPMFAVRDEPEAVDPAEVVRRGRPRAL